MQYFSKMALSNPIVYHLDKNTLIESNFKDWFQNLKLVFGMEKIQDILDNYVPETLPKESSEEWVEWEMIRDQDLRAMIYILAFMSNEL